MISVVVFGQKPDNIARLTADTLSREGAVILHTAAGINLAGSGVPAFAVDAVTRLEKLLLPRSVLVLADLTVPRHLELHEDTIVIARADNRRMHRLLSGRLNPVVTCGTGLRDTLTISSITPERAVLCAQRELPTVSGIWLEPAEFAVQSSGCGLNDLLLAAAIAAVCGFDLSDQSMIVGSDMPAQPMKHR